MDWPYQNPEFNRDAYHDLPARNICSGMSPIFFLNISTESRLTDTMKNKSVFSMTFFDWNPPEGQGNYHLTLCVDISRNCGWNHVDRLRSLVLLYQEGQV
jgi:hypothetical protein